MPLKLALMSLVAGFLTLFAPSADAQNTRNPTDPGNQTRCWDVTSNQVRTGTGGVGGSQGAIGIPPTPGSSSGRLGHIPISPNVPGGLATRPPEAASLPNC